MSFVIDDSDLPCTAAGVGGILVPEELTILELCQDPEDLGIVYIIATIRGVYAYTPTLNVAWDDKDVSADGQYIPGYKGEGVVNFPIDNKCETHTVTLAYNIGALIPSFKTVAAIDFDLTFNGSSDLISENDLINDTFQSSNPSAQQTFQKGLSPTPYKVYFDSVTNKLKVQFTGLGDKPCVCAIDCAIPTEDDLDITVCKDEVQEVTINKSSIVGDPTKATITFVDSIGNLSEIKLQLLNGVKPLRPQALDKTNPTHVTVTFPYVTENGKNIDKENLYYQVLRYENTSDSAKVWKDWSNQPTNSFVDADVKSDRTYGYAVRFRGEFGETSQLSKWTIVYVT